jgi:hypothetical protein
MESIRIVRVLGQKGLIHRSLGKLAFLVEGDGFVEQRSSPRSFTAARLSAEWKERQSMGRYGV